MIVWFHPAVYQVLEADTAMEKWSDISQRILALLACPGSNMVLPSVITRVGEFYWATVINPPLPESTQNQLAAPLLHNVINTAWLDLKDTKKIQW